MRGVTKGMTMTTLNMDTVGFLQTVNRLERRFGELTSPEAMREACAHPEGRDPVDHRLYELSSAVFGCGGWTMTMCVTASSLIGRLIDECRRFVEGSASIVREYGMAAWLYDLINDSTKAVFVGDPSDRMPMCIQPVDGKELVRRCARNGKRRYGPKRQRMRSMIDHMNQMHWLAAYSMLRWGEREPRSLEIADMLLTQPGLGMCLLREDDTVMALGAVPDTGYRRPVAYIRQLRAAGDLEYARALADGEATPLDGERVPGFAEVDARYVYDAERLIEAYEAMWREGGSAAFRSGSEILQSVERGGGNPDVPLWRNTVYLRDLADSLMGPLFGGDLSIGFEQGDRARFDEGVAQLREFVEFVKEVGVLMLPACVLQFYADLQMRDLYRKLDDRVWKEYGCLFEEGGCAEAVGVGDGGGEGVGTGGGDCADCADRVKGDAIDGDIGGGAEGDAEGDAGDDAEDGRNELLEIGAGLAAVTLARMPDETLARRGAIAMLQCDPSRYNVMVMELLERENITLDEDGEAVLKDLESQLEEVVPDIVDMPSPLVPAAER